MSGHAKVAAPRAPEIACGCSPSLAIRCPVGERLFGLTELRHRQWVAASNVHAASGFSDETGEKLLAARRAEARAWNAYEDHIEARDEA